MASDEEMRRLAAHAAELLAELPDLRRHAAAVGHSRRADYLCDLVGVAAAEATAGAVLRMVAACLASGEAVA